MIEAAPRPVFSSARRRNRFRQFGLITLAVALIAGDLLPAELPAQQSLTNALLVEREMLQEDVAKHAVAATARNAMGQRVTDLHRALDEVVAAPAVQGAAERLERLLSQIDVAEGDRDAAFDAERLLLERILERERRIGALERRLAELRSRDERHVVGEVTGTWSLTLMPIDQRGRCRLTQDGTLVRGTYELDGGFSGSLQGTFVNRTLVLQRIDSRLGKSMELRGALAPDAQRMRGTWLNFELAGSVGGSGHWVAERLPTAEESESEPSPER